jgi:cell wall-associated NlpC family hydrolase
MKGVQLEMKNKKMLAMLLTGSMMLSGAIAGGAQKVEAAPSAGFVSYAKSLMGIPYRWGGTTTKGFDCSGFIRYLYAKEKVSLPRTAYAMYKTGTSVSRSGLRTGDLVFFKTSRSAPVTHAGVYIGGGKFIHSSSSRGVSISSVNDRYYWGSRYVGAKRIK